MNILLIPLIMITVSHVALAYMFRRLENTNTKLRTSNVTLRQRLQVLEEELRFFSKRLTK